MLFTFHSKYSIFSGLKKETKNDSIDQEYEFVSHVKINFGVFGAKKNVKWDYMNFDANSCAIFNNRKLFTMRGDTIYFTMGGQRK